MKGFFRKSLNSRLHHGQIRNNLLSANNGVKFLMVKRFQLPLVGLELPFFPIVMLGPSFLVISLSSFFLAYLKSYSQTQIDCLSKLCSNSICSTRPLQSLLRTYKGGIVCGLKIRVIVDSQVTYWIVVMPSRK